MYIRCGEILSLVPIFIFLCLKLLSYIIIYYHTLPNPKTKENKICTKNKIAPQHIYWPTVYLPFFAVMRSIFFFPSRYVINKLVYALAVHLSSYGCTFGEIWRALVKLELLSAIASSNCYASLVLSKLPACIHNSIDAR